MIEFWKEIINALSEGEKVCLLYVIESEGSSPGRQCFKMFVTEKGKMKGSIGGGIMEQKLIELAKSRLQQNIVAPFIKQQIHRKDINENRSGMICSGEQTIAFYFLDENQISIIDKIVNSDSGVIELNEKGIFFHKEEIIATPITCTIESSEKWKYKQSIEERDTVFIVGAGHVGLALSQTMKQLGFYVVLLDNRENLNTMHLNQYADKKLVINYDHVGQFISEGNRNYVALVSFGFKTDEQVLRQIIHKNFKYVGMMGSKEKIRQLFENMKSDGFSELALNKIHAPIGIPIKSKTVEEIAISIAAQIIQVKNN